MNTVFKIAIGLLFFGFAGGAQAQKIEDELRYLLDTHPQLEAARKRQLASEDRVNEARSSFLPQVDVISDIGREFVDKPNASSTELTRKSARLRLTQNVFSGNRISGQLNVAKINQTLAENDLTIVTQRLLFRGFEVYLDVLASEELSRLASQNVASIQTQLTLEDERVRRGAGASIDVLFAKSRLQVAKENQAFFRGQFEDALVRYQRVFGRPARSEFL